MLCGITLRQTSLHHCVLKLLRKGKLCLRHLKKQTSELSSLDSVHSSKAELNSFGSKNTATSSVPSEGCYTVTLSIANKV